MGAHLSVRRHARYCRPPPQTTTSCTASICTTPTHQHWPWQPLVPKSQDSCRPGSSEPAARDGAREHSKEAWPHDSGPPHSGKCASVAGAEQAVAYRPVSWSSQFCGSSVECGWWHPQGFGGPGGLAPQRRPGPPSWSHPLSQRPRSPSPPGPSVDSDSSDQASLASPSLKGDSCLRRRLQAHGHSSERLSLGVSCRTGFAVAAARERGCNRTPRPFERIFQFFTLRLDGA